MNFDKRYNELLGIGAPALRPKAQNPKGYDPVSKTPSWLALAALNEIVASEEQAKLAQGAATKPLPSVKEQLSQKAKLMNAEGQQQQQGQQQMMEQMAQAPQPTPEGIPQPEPQPQQEPQPGQMMAQGGLAKLPVDSRMFDYREGGIIGFANEGVVPAADARANLDAVKAQAEQAIANLRTYGTIKQQQDPEGYQQAIQAAKAAAQAVQEASKQAEQTYKQADRAAYAANPPYIAPQKPFRNFTPPAAKKVEPQGSWEAPAQAPSVPPAPAASVPPAGLPSVLPQRPGQPRLDTAPPPPAAAAPRPRVAPPAQPPAQQAPAGLGSLPPAAPQQSPVDMAKGISAAFPISATAPTPEAMLSEREKFRQASGAKRVGEPQGEELSAYQAETARLRKARDEANAMETLSGYGGLAGLGQRRAAIMQRDNLADTIRNDATEKMRVAMEGMKQAEAEGNMTKYAALKKEATDAQNTRANADSLAASSLTKEQMQNQTTLRSQQMQTASAEKIAEARDATSVKVANIQAAAQRFAAEGRLGGGEAKQVLAAAKAELDSVQKEITELSKNPFLAANKARIAELRPQLDTLRKSISTLEGGGTMAPSPGAKAPALKYNPATGKIE